MKKIDETIENICDWINQQLNDSLTTEESQVTAVMVSALSELVEARVDSDLEKRVADLEGQVQSQQKIDINSIADNISHQIEELHCIRRIMEFQNATPRNFHDPDSRD